MEQQHLSNAVALWKRSTDANLNDLVRRPAGDLVSAATCCVGEHQRKADDWGDGTDPDPMPPLQEECSEQLKAVTDLAAIISGFEMIAFLQFQFDSTQVSKALQLAYVTTCGLTVSVTAPTSQTHHHSCASNTPGRRGKGLGWLSRRGA